MSTTAPVGRGFSLAWKGFSRDWRCFGLAWRGFSLAVVVCVFFVLPASAQDPARPARPFRGLFGGAQADSTRTRSLDLNLSFLGGYDDNVMAGTSGTGGSLGDPRFGQSGGMANASASLTYRRTRRADWIEAGARTGFRYFPSLTELNAADYSANMGFSVRPSRRMQLAMSDDVSYQPFFSLAAVPVFGAVGGQLPAATVDYAVVDRPSLNYGATVDASYELTRRTRASGNYSFRGFDFTRSSDEGRMRHHGARAGLARDLTRRVALGGRYTYDYGQGSYVGPGIETRSHGGEVTLDYRRQLRSRRQVSFGVSSGFSRIERAGDDRVRRFDRSATAAARVAMDVGRTWVVNGDYRRGLRYLPGVRDPVFSDDVQARLAGLVGRRLDLAFGAQYSKGIGGFSSLSGFSSATGNAQARWAISRMAAMTWSYVYYRYEFPPGAVLPPGLDRRFNRHAVRVGVDLWLPLYR